MPKAMTTVLTQMSTIFSQTACSCGRKRPYSASVPSTKKPNSVELSSCRKLYHLKRRSRMSACTRMKQVNTMMTQVPSVSCGKRRLSTLGMELTVEMPQLVEREKVTPLAMKNIPTT